MRLNTETTTLPDGNILKLLKESPDPYIGDLQHKIEQRLQAGVEAIEQWLQSPSQCVPNAVVELLGCGEGLTPAGDDILVGTMVTLHQLNCAEKFSSLARCINTQADIRTNHISLAHLYASCEGMAVDPLHRLINAIFSDDTSSVQQAIEALNNYGHRSGRDAMRGVTAVVCALLRS